MTDAIAIPTSGKNYAALENKSVPKDSRKKKNAVLNFSPVRNALA
jgi:hypothetical protein